MTLTLLLIFTAGCSEKDSTNKAEEKLEPLVIKCEQKLPEFTLGPESRPSKKKVADLCSCVWNKLEGWEKDTSIAISEGREREVSKMNLMAFPSRFGKVMDSCGAMEL